MALLGIDVGTGGCKVVAFRENGEVLALAFREYPFITPRPGWLEIDPRCIVQAVREALQEVVSRTPVSIDALAVTSHGETLVPLGQDGTPLAMAIANFDTRANRYVKLFRERFDPMVLFAMTGMPLHGMYTVNKILWFRDHKPQIFEKTWKFSCVADFITSYLTGEEPVMDYSLASRTMMLDVRKKTWAKEILEAVHLEEERLPKLLPAGSFVGYLRGDLACELGLQGKVPVAIGGHDQPCGVLGCGVRRHGEAMYSIGTSECVALHIGPEPLLGQGMMEHGFCASPHVGENAYLTLAYIASGGSVVRWFRDVLALDIKARTSDPYRELFAHLPQHPVSVFVLPHFAGSGTPYLDEHSRGAIVGLTLAASRFDILRGILESLTYEMRLNLDLLASFGLPVFDLRVIGGGARSPEWLRIKADILGKPLFLPEVEEAVALGTAILAGKMRGVFADTREGIEAMVRFRGEVRPSPQHAVYERYYEVYRKLYNGLREINVLISRLEGKEEDDEE
ncbi:MAG: FGGY family carbohydrate kinase [Candidatus Caldatribacterium sp.]|uniref:FGGY-family carbohydrate kinase n=1 Tax=Candidatus Caldatribacterium sp. TaxID=2282143 RepID=UPI0029913632|nr:FGGY family carbohydrate kinase [Candidatus Caldatribacterium sp.]MCX7730960.1 FGGY family carbohydrate kinase [Candidatus Caldatribacterium sp.]MDW8081089.1 FGGY family carbohydrate kinase [Candidatus Calescibacterium sp.]